MFSWNLRGSCAIVSEVIFATRQALFEVCVAMKFRQHVKADSRFQMKAISILTDDMLEKSFLLKGEKRHMGIARKGL